MEIKPGTNKNVGLPITLALSFLPAVIWFFLRPFPERFSGFASAMASFGQITGLIGMAMFSLNLILGGRIKSLENYFGGLDKVYATHAMLGSLSFMLLLFHPLFLAIRYIPVSLKAAASFLLPGTDRNIDFGIIALMGMMLLMVITLFVKLLYQNWKVSHKFFGLVFFFAGLHSFLIPSDISRSDLLRTYMLLLALGGMAAAIRRSLMKKTLVKKLKYAIENVRRLNENVIEIEMSPEGERLEFSPGQFIFISFYSSEVTSESHPFSISSSPYEKNLKITVKALGDYTSLLQNIKTGSMAEIEGPFGKFFSGNLTDSNQIWIAGGIGITPFLSMARSIKILKPNHGIDLYYCVADKNEAVFLKELENIKTENGSFNLIPFYSKIRQYRISAEFIKKTSDGLDSKEIFLCGPPPMMAGLKKQFLNLNIPATNIHFEKFNLL